MCGASFRARARKPPPLALWCLCTRGVSRYLCASRGPSVFSSAVEVALDGGGDGSDLGGELGLDAVEVVAVVEGDEVDGEAEVAEAARAADAVEVGLARLGEVEVDDHVDRLDVDPPREEVRRDQVPSRAVAELVEDPVACGRVTRALKKRDTSTR